jgi:hypothetical protein
MGINQVPAPVATNPVKGIALPAGTGVPGSSSSMTASGTFDAGVYQVHFSGDVNNVTLGNQTFSATGRTKKLLTSTTSSTVVINRQWTAGSGQSGGVVNSVTWGTPGQYITTAYGTAPRTQVTTSTDLSTWTTRTTIFSPTRYPRAVRFLNGIYVLVGDTGGIQTSTDGITWTTRTSGTTDQLNDVTWGGGVYVSGGTNARIISSTDAVTWTSRTSNVTGTNEITSIIYAGGIFLAGATSGQLSTSTDGTTWTARTTNMAGEAISQIAYGNSTYVLGGGNGQVRSSTDGITWTTRSVSTYFGTNQVQAVGFGNGYFFIAGVSSGAASTDGITWVGNSYNMGASPAMNAAFAGGYYFIVGGSAGTSRLQYSPSTSVFGATNQDSGVTWNYASELSYT